MRKMILSALAASLALSPMATSLADAQTRTVTTVRHDRHGNTVVRRTTAVRPRNNHRWQRGQRFDRRYANHYGVINDWHAYRGRRLYAPPRGYHWVRSGNDAVLVGVTSGIIGAVLAGALN